MTTAGTDVARAAAAAGFPARELVTAVAVAWAESSFDERAINTSNRDGSTDYGLWQINSVHRFPELSTGAWADPKVNAQLAHRVWKAQGWNAWSVHKPSNGTGYARYLAAIPAATAFVTAAVGPGAGAVGAAQSPFSAAQGVAGAGSDALNIVATIAKEPLATLRWLQEPGSWWRIASFAIGSALTIGGVYLLVTSSIAKPVVKAAKKVAT